MEEGVKVAKQSRSRGVAIGVASGGRAVPVDWAIAMSTIVYPVNTNTSWIHIVGHDIADARELIAEKAIEIGCKYLWFVDDDTVPPQDAARQLIYVLEQEEAKGSNVMVCGGIYCPKLSPPEPLVLMGPGEGSFWKWKKGDVFPCWGLGTGCMMIRTEVFAHLEKPWFKTTQEAQFTQTDDLYFCEKVHKAGFDVLAHGGVLCTHWDLANGIVYSLPKSSYPMLPKEAEIVVEVST